MEWTRNYCSGYLVTALLGIFLLFADAAYAQSYLLYADVNVSPNKIYRIKTDGTGNTAIITLPDATKYVMAIAVDQANSILYYYTDNATYNAGKIYKSDLNGGAITQFLDVSTVGGTGGMAAGGGYLYYAPSSASFTTGQIIKIKSDGTSPLTLYTSSGGYISEVALDVPNSMLYFIDAVSPYQVYKCDLTGAGKTSLFNNGTYNINALSAGNGYFFYSTGQGPWSLFRRNSSGGAYTQVWAPPSGGTAPVSAYDLINKNLYFEYNGDGKIYKAGADGTGAAEFLTLGTGYDLPSACMAAAPNTVYPVELTSFTGFVSGKIVKLSWKTATELKNYGFDIERRVKSEASSENWQKVGFAAGHGSSNTPNEYTYKDKPNTLAKLEYRLKQIDLDGTSKYSSVVEVQAGLNPKAELKQNYPNPFNPETVINYQIPVDGYVTLKVYDMIGREVTTLVDKFQESGNYNVQFSIQKQNVPDGVYLYTLRAGSFVVSKKMIVLK